MLTVETNYREQAKQKLSADMNKIKGAKESAMKQEIKEALCSFIEQDNEFAQAVVEGGSFSDCMKKVAKGVGSSISDIDAIRKAVRFYFDNAVVNFSMTINVNPYDNNAPKPDTQKKSVLNLSLDDLF